VFEGRTVVATHPRVAARTGHRVVLDHYLEVLPFKPGAPSTRADRGSRRRRDRPGLPTPAATDHPSPSTRPSRWRTRSSSPTRGSATPWPRNWSNELVEAADDKQLAKTIARYGRVDLLMIDELGYMELDRRGAELLFQVLTEREEKASVEIASNDSFGKAHRFPATCAR